MRQAEALTRNIREFLVKTAVKWTYKHKKQYLVFNSYRRDMRINARKRKIFAYTPLDMLAYIEPVFKIFCACVCDSVARKLVRPRIKQF